MSWFYDFFFQALWVVFFVYWQIKAANTKTTQRLEPAASRILRVFIFVVAIVLLSTTRIPLPFLYLHLWPASLWGFWFGAAVTIAGLLFAVWAREHLGRNRSRSVTIKQGHELITSVLFDRPSSHLHRNPDRVPWHGDCNFRCAGSSSSFSSSCILAQAPHRGTVDAHPVRPDLCHLRE